MMLICTFVFSPAVQEEEELLHSPGVGVRIAQMLNVLVKVLRSLHLSNMWMDLVYNLPIVRYWSEVLYCTILTLRSRSQT